VRKRRKTDLGDKGERNVEGRVKRVSKRERLERE